MKPFKLSLFLLLLGSCISDKKQYDRIDSAEIREAMTIKDGSYFIYKDSISGEEDSFWVKGYGNGFWEYDDLRYRENIDYYAYNSFGSQFLFTADGTEFQGIEWIAGYFRIDSNTFWKFRPLSSPIRSNDVLEMFFIGYFDTYTAGGKVYNRVYNYKNADTAANHAISYYSPESGLVKFEIRNASTHKVYELIRSKIIK